jgi:hypothetical protein
MSDEWTRHATDPDGRDVMFDVGSRARPCLRHVAAFGVEQLPCGERPSDGID